MTQGIAVLAVLAFLAAWTWFLYRSSGGRIWSPLWTAFSTTAMAIVLFVTGVSGFTLDNHTRFVSGTSWSGHVIWSQVWLGIGAALVALFFWRRGLRSLGGRR